jgi:hypothetical protein
MRIRVEITKLNENCQDVGQWFNRYELYIDLSRDNAPQVEDKTAIDSDRLRYLPLHLEGDTLLCFEQRDSSIKTYDEVKQLLCSMFELSSSEAYALFSSATFVPGLQSVDAFVSNLRKLATVFLGQNSDKSAMSSVVKERFLQSVGPSIAREINILVAKDPSKSIDLDAVLSVARHMPALKGSHGVIGAIGGGHDSDKEADADKDDDRQSRRDGGYDDRSWKSRQSGSNRRWSSRDRSSSRDSRNRNQWNHGRDNSSRSVGNYRNSKTDEQRPVKGSLMCFLCGEGGHKMYECELLVKFKQMHSGKVQGSAGSAASAPNHQ